jgi:hypothetical protein
VDPKNDINAAESFLEDTFSAYIITAACKALNIPSSEVLSDNMPVPDSFVDIGHLIV